MTLNTRPCKLNLILLCRPAVDIRHVLHPTYSSELAEWPHKSGRYFQGEDQGLGLGFVGHWGSLRADIFHVDAVLCTTDAKQMHQLASCS